MADTLVAVDPGLPNCSAAAFAGTDLYRVYWWWPGALVSIGGANRRAVCEIPQVDGRGVPAHGLIKLAAAGALCAARLSRASVQFVTPSEWKGQQKKPIHHGRMWLALTFAERELLGGAVTARAIEAAKARGAAGGWRKPSQSYYRARELATVDGLRIDHNILDAVALGLWALGRIDRTGQPRRAA